MHNPHHQTGPRTYKPDKQQEGKLMRENMNRETPVSVKYDVKSFTRAFAHCLAALEETSEVPRLLLAVVQKE